MGKENMNSQRRAMFAEAMHSLRGYFLSLASERSPWLQILGFNGVTSPHLLLQRLSEHSVMEGTLRTSRRGEMPRTERGSGRPMVWTLRGDTDVPCSSRHVLLDWVASLEI